MREPSYVEETAIALARLVGAQRGSVIYHAIVGCLRDVTATERKRIARLVSRYNYVDGKACAKHIRDQGAKRDRALATPTTTLREEPTE